ncbi:hypothetical protein [Glycomyces niveus]|uniref:Uncharacterized protein n=1 Tax=Glycomyces niveus TaxID=2820287 RepID=A0ABS3UAN4_9ACTN|nr:hypothetical protein [Glycomyces sp. NEAU-S30]MBO3735831.1 hypothetical protein [Glycomyces sp. NEAU-S30]
MNNGFNLDPEMIDNVATGIFTLSEDLYSNMNLVVVDSDGLEGSVDTAAFTGVAEVLQAVGKWGEEFVPTHRHGIEEFAGYLVVAIRSTEEIDDYVSSEFDQYADQFPRSADVPAPALPSPDPADAVPVPGGLDVAV